MITKEGYREMYHRVREENVRLRLETTANRESNETDWTELQHILDTTEGYFRMGKSQNSHYWARWKWTKGAHAGRYVIGGHSTLESAVLVMLEAYSAVEAGRRVAPLDTGYQSKYNNSQR